MARFEFRGIDIELFVATEILRLKSLHYGYWDSLPSKDDLTLKTIRLAQTRFTDRLLSYIPEGVHDVLDVGAGIGDNAQALARRGYSVTAISPDKNHPRYFDALREKEGITFCHTTFERFDLRQQFDLILMSESLNYIDRHVGLQQCQRYLRPHGHLLVAAMFRRPGEQGYGPSWSPTDLDYVTQAREYGLSLIAAEDITSNVVPTLEYAYSRIEKYVTPTFSMLRKIGAGSVFRGTFEKLDEARRYYDRRVNPQYFNRYVRYVVLLFEHASRSATRGSCS